MTDSNSPEPGPKPASDKPKNIFDIKREPFTPRPLAEPDHNYNPAQGFLPDKDSAPITDQETLFRAAAIKCAKMERELARLMKETQEDHIPKGIPAVKLYKNKSFSSFESGLESFGDSRKGWIFFEDGSGITGKNLGMDTSCTLIVGLHTDIETYHAYQEFLRKNPDTRGRGNTTYLFTKDGEYRKISNIAKGVKVDPSRPYLGEADNPLEWAVSYESPMTADDFELAGQALTALKKRIINPLWDRQESQEEKTAE
jgi:hypothetical protein